MSARGLFLAVLVLLVALLAVPFFAGAARAQAYPPPTSAAVSVDHFAERQARRVLHEWHRYELLLVGRAATSMWPSLTLAYHRILT